MKKYEVIHVVEQDIIKFQDEINCWLIPEEGETLFDIKYANTGTSYSALLIFESEYDPDEDE